MNNFECLEGTVVEIYDEKLAEITINNPENNWDEYEQDMIGEDK